MRIIHGTDYYDSVLAFGRDESIVLVREKMRHLDQEQQACTKEIIPPHVGIRAKHPKRGSTDLIRGWLDPTGRNHLFLPVKVWAAGSEWNGICYRSGGSGHPSSIGYLWQWKQFKSMVEGQGLTIEDRESGVRAEWWRPANINENWFGERPSDHRTISWMIENRASIITCMSDDYQRIWNIRMNGDNLRDMQFFKAVDAYSMFQRLSQWVGGVLPGHGNAVVEITDDRIKIHKHGFDGMSFKKPPSKKGRACRTSEK